MPISKIVSSPQRPGKCFALTLAFASLLCGSAHAKKLAEPLTAQRLAAAIDSHYNHLHSLQVQFTQTYDGMGMNRVEQGTLLLGKSGRLHAGKMRWTYTRPQGKLFVFDGTFAYFYTPGQSEVQRVPAKQLDDLRSPLALLLGHADLGKQLDGMTMTPAANGEETLSGIPHGLSDRVSELKITATVQGVIHTLVIEDKDGARNSFTFSNEQPDVPAPDGDFHFTPPPGTHVVSGMAPI
jgi:outer membrane lipoprotein carrier protein